MGVDHRWRLARPPTELVLLGATVAVVVAFGVLPAVSLFAGSIARDGGGAALGRAVTAPTDRADLLQSLLQGGLSAGGAVGVGYPAGVFLGRYHWPGRETVRSALLLPFLLPSLIMVVGLLDLFGPTGLVGSAWPASRWFSAGLPGIVALNLFYNVPIVVVLTATGCESASPELEEAVASLGGSPTRAYLESWAAPSAIGAACGGLLTFVFSALSFAPPILLCGNRCDTVEVRVYQLAELLGQPAAAGVLALVLVLAFLAPTLAYVVLARRLRAARAGRPRRRRLSWRSPATWGTAAVFALVLAAEGVLVLAVLYRSFSPSGGAPSLAAWQALLSSATPHRIGIGVGSASANTLGFAALAASVGLVLAVTSAFVLARRPRLGPGLALLLFVPVLLSPVVLALALEQFWQNALGGPSNVWLLIVLSEALLGAPFALQSLEIPLAGLPVGGAESARALGASPWGAFVDAELPRIRRGIQTAILFAFALGLGEFTATYFLVTPQPQFRTLPVAIYALADLRFNGAASAAAALLLLLSVGVFAGIIASGGDDAA